MKNVWEFLVKGGICMIPLFLCSVIGLAIVIEKFISLRRRKIIVPEVVSVLENIKGTNDFPLAVSICEQHHGPFANIIRIALENHSLPREEIKETIFDQGRQEVHELEKGLGVLETVAGIGPLLGLLGTVLGILKVFKVISVMGVGQATSLAGGISEALITTIAGLFIGIPALVAYNYFGNKAEGLVLEIEKYSNRLLNKIRIIAGEGGSDTMQLRAKPRKKVFINITSLIDVIFMMLLFFMITSTFLEQPGIKLELPTAKTSANAEPQKYVLTVDKKGELFLNRQPVTLAGLEAEIRKALPEMKDGALVLKADQEITHGLVVRVMDMAKRGGVKKLIIGTKPEK